MKCSQPRPGFELVSPCPFPTTITITPRAPPKIQVLVSLCIFFYFHSMVCWDGKIHKMASFLIFLITRTDLQAGIKQSACISKSQRILYVSRADSGLYIYIYIYIYSIWLYGQIWNSFTLVPKSSSFRATSTDFPGSIVVLYHRSFPAGLLNFVLCPYRTVVYKFMLLGQHLQVLISSAVSRMSCLSYFDGFTFLNRSINILNRY